MTTVLTSLITIILATIKNLDRVIFNLWINFDFITNSICLLFYSSPYNNLYHRLCFICHKYPEFKLRNVITLNVKHHNSMINNSRNSFNNSSVNMESQKKTDISDNINSSRKSVETQK